MTYSTTGRMMLGGLNGGGTSPSATPSTGSTGGYAQMPAYEMGPTNFNTYMEQNGVPSFESTQNRYNELAGQAKNLFSSKNYLNEVSGLKNMLMAQGTNAANAAGMQYADAARRSGTSGQGAGVARALSLIPAQAEARRLGLAGEEFRSRQDAQRASYMANLQSELANNQQAYRQMLAGYNSNLFGIQNSSSQWRSELANDDAQWRAQLAENQRQFNVTNSRGGSGSSGSGSGTLSPYNRSTGEPLPNYYTVGTGMDYQTAPSVGWR